MNFDSFLLSLQLERNLSRSSIRAYANDLSLFDRFADSRGVINVAGIDRDLIVGFIQNLKDSPNGRLGLTGLSDASISRRLAVISSFLDYTRATTMPELANPVRHMRRRSKSNRGCKAVSEEILSQLISGITVIRDKAMISLYLATGLRLTELRQLNRDSIAFERRTDEAGIQRIEGSGQVLGKGSKLRRFYLNEEAVLLLAQYLSTRNDSSEALFISERKQRISSRAIQYTLTSWCQKLGLPHIHPHTLRHVYATRLANSEIDPMQLKDLMGHSDFSVTMGYFKIYEETLARGYFSAMELYRTSS